jgi:hypothetical protein
MMLQIASREKSNSAESRKLVAGALVYVNAADRHLEDLPMLSRIIKGRRRPLARLKSDGPANPV